MPDNNQLTKFDSTRIIDIIDRIPNLTQQDKHELSQKIASEEVEVRNRALEKIAKSRIAQHDFSVIMNELAEMKKQGMYVHATQQMETGSGHFSIKVKGGDTKLIIPVLLIIAFIIIVSVVLIIAFSS